MASELKPAATEAATAIPKGEQPSASPPMFGNLTEYVPGDSIQTHREMFEAFCEVNRIEDNRKWSFLLISLGTPVYEKLRNLVHPRQPNEFGYNHIWTALEQFYNPRPSMVSERLKFYTAKQQPNEAIHEFTDRLQKLAETCEFGSFIPTDLSTITSAKLREKAIDEALRDQMIAGVCDERVQKGLAEKKLAEKFLFCRLRAQSMCLQLATSSVKVESAEPKQQQSAVSTAVTASVTVKAVPDRNLGVAKQSKAITHTAVPLKCTRCGRPGSGHTFKTCPAKNWYCYCCGHLGHAESVCTTKWMNYYY